MWESFSQIENQNTTDPTEELEEIITIEHSEVHDLSEEENNWEGSQSNSTAILEDQISQPSCSMATQKRPRMELKDIKNDVRSFKRSKKTDNKALGEALTGALSHFTTVISKKDDQKENRTDPEDLFGAMVAQYLRKISDTTRKISVKADILHLLENNM